MPQEKQVSRRSYVKYVGGVVAVAVVAAAGYGIYEMTKPTAPEKVKVSVQWYTGPEDEAFVKQHDYWNANYKDMTGIESVHMTISRMGYFEKLESQMIAGATEPTIWEFWSYHTGKYAQYCEPLDEYMKDPALFSSPKGEAYSYDDFLDFNKAAQEYKGKVYGFGEHIAWMTSFWRTDLLEKNIDTMDELLDVARKFSKSTNPNSPTQYGVTFGGSTGTTTWKTWVAFYSSFGGQYFKPGTFEPDFDSEAAVKAMDLYITLAKEKLVPPDITTYEYVEILGSIQSGQVAYGLEWSPAYPDLTTKDKSPQVWDKLKMDLPPGDKYRKAYVGGGIYAINKNSPVKKQGFKLLSWLTLGEGARMFTKEGQISPVKSIFADQAFVNATPPLKVLADIKAAEYGVAEPSYVDLPTIQDIGSVEVSNTLALKYKNGSEAAAALQKAIYDYMKSKGYF